MDTEPQATAKPPPAGRLTFGGKETLIDRIIRFSGDESGAPAVEYAFLLMFIAVAIAASVSTFGNAVHGLFQNAVTKWNTGS